MSLPLITDMNSRHPKRPARRWIFRSAGATLTLLAGCTGLATNGEMKARSQAQAVAQQYRPNGDKPKLPKLTSNSGLRNYLTFAVLNQPKIEAAYYEWLASIETITQARSLPDPQLTYQMDIQDIVTSIMPGVMQSIPWPAKLRDAAQVASEDSYSKYYAFQSEVLRSAFEVKRTYYQLHFLAEKLRVDRETLRLLGDLEATARAQNEAGKVTLQDVLRAQIEQESLKTEIANLEDSRSALMAQFKAALGLGGNQPAPPMPTRLESTSLSLTADQVFKAALAQNTQLKSMAADVRAAEATITLANRTRLPDFGVGLMADVKMNPTLLRPLGSVSLPIWRDKIAAQIAEAQAGKRSAEARLSDAQIALAVNVAERTYLYREATRNLTLLNSQLLPKAQQSLEVARSGYLTDQIDFFNLIDTQRTLLGFELDKVEVAMQREIVLAELSLIVQGMPSSGEAMGTGARATTSKGRGARSSMKKAGGM